MLKMMPLLKHMGTSSSSPSTLKCLIVQCPITKQDSEPDCVMKLLKMNMEKLLMQQDKQQPQMLHTRLWISP